MKDVAKRKAVEGGDWWRSKDTPPRHHPPSTASLSWPSSTARHRKKKEKEDYRLAVDGEENADEIMAEAYSGWAAAKEIQPLADL